MRRTLSTPALIVIATPIIAILAMAWLGALNSGAYRATKSYVRSSAEIQSRLGTIRRTGLTSYSEIGNGFENANIALVAYGDKGRGNICARLQKSGGKWSVIRMNLNGTILLGDPASLIDSSCMAKLSRTAFTIGG